MHGDTHTHTHTHTHTGLEQVGRGGGPYPWEAFIYYLFIYLFIYLSIYLFIYILFIFIYIFIYLFIYVLNCKAAREPGARLVSRGPAGRLRRD